mmetsp:Transcript_30859/g.49653  ORF Transcript_30859/g.49653 Transcript_30859/m.49653 type:complete len:401 (+) Transcript_30859:182-1384(+)
MGAWACCFTENGDLLFSGWRQRLIDEEEENGYEEEEAVAADREQLRRRCIAASSSVKSRMKNAPSPSISTSSSVIEYHHLQRIIDNACSSSGTTRVKAPRRLRILCLHGAASNSKILAFSLRHLEAKIKEISSSSLSSSPSSIEFVMLDSPLELSRKQVQLWGDPDILKMFGNNGDLKYFLWYKHQLYQRMAPSQKQKEGGRGGGEKKEDKKSKETKARTRIINLPTKLWHRGTHLAGLEKSLKHISAFYHEKGPFDGILGFSQGGATAALLAALKPRWFNFVVSIAGFVSPPINALYKTINQHEEEGVGETEGGCSLLPPLLQVHGKLDETVTLSDGKKLCSKFGTTSKMFVHDGAHHPPTRNQAAALESIAKFILQFVPTGTNTRENAGITAAATALM